MSKIEHKNLVVLQYTKNECDIEVVKLGMRRLKDIVSVNCENGTWEAHISNEANDKRQILKIGYDARDDEDDLVYKVIGLYDNSNPKHLTEMCNHASNAKEHTLLCERGFE